MGYMDVFFTPLFSKHFPYFLGEKSVSQDLYSNLSFLQVSSRWLKGIRMEDEGRGTSRLFAVSWQLQPAGDFVLRKKK